MFIVSLRSFCDLEKYMEDMLTSIWKFVIRLEKTYSGSEIVAWGYLIPICPELRWIFSNTSGIYLKIYDKSFWSNLYHHINKHNWAVRISINFCTVRIQNGQYFPSFSIKRCRPYLTSLLGEWNISTYERQGKYWPYCTR